MAKSASRSMCSGWWITETTGVPGGLDAQQAPAQALVVEDDVEAVALLEVAPAAEQPQPEGLHLRERRRSARRRAPTGSAA